jgi:tetratricopeptide (TPR) repeat protein
VAWLRGDLPAAMASLRRAVALYGKLGDKPGQAYALDQLGMAQQLTGDYPAALASREQALTLAQASGDRLVEAMTLTHLSGV